MIYSLPGVLRLLHSLFSGFRQMSEVEHRTSQQSSHEHSLFCFLLEKHEDNKKFEDMWWRNVNEEGNEEHLIVMKQCSLLDVCYSNTRGMKSAFLYIKSSVKIVEWE